MLLTIHNLPATTRYGDIKGLLQTKCGLQQVILDNLIAEGNSKKVTVGVSEDADAAILVRKINGLYWNGQQLYVEDVRQQKAKSEQPFRLANPQVQQEADQFPTLNLLQNSSYDKGMAPNTMPGVHPMMAMCYVPGYNQEYQAGSTEQMLNAQTAYMGMGGYPQNSMQMSQLGMTPQLQYLNQQGNNQSSVGKTWEYSYEKPPEMQSFGLSPGFNQGFGRQESPQREQPWIRGSDGRRRNDYDNRPERSCEYHWNESEQPIPQDVNFGRRPDRPNEQFLNRSNDRPVEFSRQPDDWQGRNEFTERMDRSEKPFECRPNDLKRNEFSGSPGVRQERLNEFSGRPNERQGRPNEFSGRPNERQGRPNEFSGRPNERQGRPNEIFERPNERQGRPNVFSGRAYEREGRPNEFSGRPYERQGKPNEFSGRPNQRQGRPNEFSELPNERQGKPNEFSGRPNQRQGRPNEFSGLPNERQGKPNEFSGRPNQRQGRPNEFSGLPNERRGRSYEFSGRSNERQGRLNEFSGQANKHPNRSTEPPRPLPSKRPNFDRSANRPTFARTENPNPKSFDQSRKRKMERPDGVVPKASRDYLSQRQESKPLTIQLASNRDNEELSEEAKEKVSKQLRRQGAKKVIAEIYASQGMEDPDLITRQAVNKFVISRIDELVGDKLMVSPLECYDIYRNRYPSTDDPAALAEISVIIATRKENEELGTKKGVTSKPPVTKKPPVTPSPSAKSANVPPKGLTKGEKLTLRRREEAQAVIAQGGIPTFPMGDKGLVTKQKQESKSGYIPEVEPKLKKAIDEEVGKFIKLFSDELKNAPSADIQRAYNTVQGDDLIDEITQNVTQNLARRLLNHGLKMVRVFGRPKLPKRVELEQFLNQYGAVSLRKSQKAKLYTAAIGTYDKYDKLLAMGEAAVGDGIILSFKPLHLLPKELADQKTLRTIRKEITDSMIDKSELDLLDKNWPAKEIELKAALEAENARKQAEEDEKRALVATKQAQENKAVAENKPANGDDETQVELAEEMDQTENYIGEDQTENYIGEDFQVIDEVNELDDSEVVDYSIDNFDVDLDDECLEDY